MSTYILCIDTALSTCSVSLLDENNIISFQIEKELNTASEKINELIHAVLSKANVNINQINAIALANGPGSYTGLRIGAAVAKAIAYSLDIPIMAISTFDIMYQKAIQQYPNFNYYLPNIDARRDEIYFALFNKSNQKLIADQPQILDQSFEDNITAYPNCLIFGNATEKIKNYLPISNQQYFTSNFTYDASDMALIAYSFFTTKKFIDIAYFEPNYTKPFFLHKKIS